jgi:hypothetical protein
VFVTRCVTLAPLGAPPTAAVRSVAAIHEAFDALPPVVSRCTDTRGRCTQRCLCNFVRRFTVASVNAAGAAFVHIVENVLSDAAVAWPVVAQRQLSASDTGNSGPVECVECGTFTDSDGLARACLTFATRNKHLWLLLPSDNHSYSYSLEAAAKKHALAIELGIDISPPLDVELTRALQDNVAPFRTHVVERVNTLHADHGFVGVFGQHNAHVLPPPAPPVGDGDKPIEELFAQMRVADASPVHIRDKGHVRCAGSCEQFIALYRHDETIWLFDRLGTFRAKVPETRVLYEEARARVDTALYETEQARQLYEHLTRAESCKCYACAMPVLRPQRCALVVLEASESPATERQTIALLDCMARVRLVCPRAEATTSAK